MANLVLLLSSISILNPSVNDMACPGRVFQCVFQPLIGYFTYILQPAYLSYLLLRSLLKGQGFKEAGLKLDVTMLQ